MTEKYIESMVNIENIRMHNITISKDINRKMIKNILRNVKELNMGLMKKKK